MVIRIKSCAAYCVGDCCFIGVLAIGAAFDQLPTVPFLTADGLLQGIFLDIRGPSDKVIDSGKDFLLPRPLVEAAV